MSSDIIDDQSTQEQSLRWGFSGNPRVPSFLLEMLRDKDITVRDFLLLAVIDLAVQKPKDGTGVGCYASNEYLGNSVGAHPNYVCNKLQELKERGLLFVIHVNGRRYLEAEWSRSTIERETLTGTYGVKLRQQHDELVARFRSLGDKEKSLSPLRKIFTGDKEKSLQNIKTEVEEEKDPPPSADGNVGGSSTKRNPIKSSVAPSLFGSAESGNNKHPRSMRLYERIVKTHAGSPNPGDPKNWEKWFVKKVADLVGLGYSRSQADLWVDSVLAAYLPLVGRHSNHKYLPAIFCGESFYRKFDKLVGWLRRYDMLLDDPFTGSTVIESSDGSSVTITLPKQGDD